MMEAQRLKRFHQAILDKLRERDSALLEEILQDLEQLKSRNHTPLTASS